MANKGSSSTPEIKINFSYENKTSANAKLKTRISEIEQVAKAIKVGIDFKSNTDTLKNLKTSLTGVRDKLNKITLDGFNKNLKEALSNTEKLVKELEKANKSPYARKVMAKSNDSSYDIKAVREAEKEAIASIKRRQEKYNEMVKESKAKIQELTKAEKESKKEAETALKQLTKAQEKADKQKIKDADKRAKEEEKSIEKITKAQQKALEKQQKAYERSLLAIEKQKEKLEIGVQNKTQKVDFQKEDYQRVLDYISQSGNISEKVLADLQKRINSLNVKSKAEEIRDISKSLSTLSKNDGEITRFNKKLEDIRTKIGNLKGQALDLKNESALQKLEELEDQLREVEQVGDDMSKGLSVNMNSIKPTIDKIDSSLKDMGNSLKTASVQAVTFSGGFKQLAMTLGLVDLGREAVRVMVTAFKDGISTVVDMDTAMADLNKVANLSAEGLNKAKDSAVQLGKEVGRSSIEVAKAQAEFGRVYKDINTINQMTKTAIIGANVMDGTTTEQVAKGLNTVISSLKLGAGDVVTILDSMNEVQNNFNISSDNMLEALSKVGSTAHTAGASLQELEGYITAISEATGADGGEIGNSLRSMMTRIYKIGEDTFDEGDPELALNAIGVAVRDVSGEFRDINDILTDLDKVWGGLTQTQKIATGQVVAGINQYDKFVSLLNNFSRATEATATAMDSAGSATKENEIYLQSIEGKLSTLKATMEGFWINLVDSDLLKTGVSLLQLLADSLVGLQNVFGSTGFSVGALTTAFISFTDNPLKKFISGIASSETPIKSLVTNFKNIKTKAIESSAGMGIAQKSALLLKTSYTQLGLQAVFATIKVVALQTALTLGLSVAISAVVGLLSSMWTGLTNVEGKIGEVTEASKELGTTLDNTTSNSVDLETYKELKQRLKDTNLVAEERKKTEEELEEVKKRLYELDGSAYAILNNQNLTYEKQLELLQKINEEKLLDKAQELDQKMTGGFWGEDEAKRVQRVKEIAEFSVDAYKELSELQKKANGGVINFKGQNIDLARQNELLEIYKTQIEDGVFAVEKYNSEVELMKSANYNTERTTFSLTDSVKEFNENLKESTEIITENTDAKNENALAGGGSGTSSVEELTKSYSSALSTLQDIYDLSQSLNDVTAMTPDLVDQVTKLFPEIGASITDVAEVQEFLNQKIKDQETIANEAYENLVSGDNNYYQNKLLNDANWIESFRQSLINMGMSQEDAYNLDLKKFDNLNQLKTYSMNTLGKGIEKWLNQYIDTSANGYGIDFSNFKSFAEAKVRILEALNAEIKKVTKNMATAQLKAYELEYSQQNSISSNFGAKAEFNKNYLNVLNQNIDKYKEQINNLNNAIAEVENKIPNIGVGGLNLGNVGFNPITASPGSSSDKGNSGSSSKQNSTYKATLEQWYTLKDAIEDVNNQIEQNQILRARASGTAKEQEYIKKEVELLKKQISLKQQLQKEMEKERNSLKSYIMSQGGVFNGENLTNYDKLLGWTATTDAGIEKLKKLEEAVKSYTDLCNSEIPGVKKEWQELQDQIDDLLGTHERYKVDTEKWFALKDQINDVNIAIERYEYLRSKATSSKQEQEYIQKEIELLQQQIVLKKKLQTEMQKERDELKKFIQQNGGKFQGNNLTNYDTLFGKEAVGAEAVEKLKKLEEAFQRYVELTNSELPEIIMEWEKLQDQINEVKNSQEKYNVELDKWYEIRDAIEDVNNALEINSIKKEQAVGKDKIDIMNQEIALYEKQIELQKQLQKEMEKEKNELKKFILENGGQFQGENLINYEALLGKEAVGSDNIEALKKLEEAVKSYMDLTNSEIPGVIKQWETLKNQIEKVKQEQVNLAIDFEKDLYDVLAHYAKKENDLRKADLEKEKEAIEEKRKLLEERKKILQETFDKEDREDAISEAQQTLNELDAQIQEALRSGDRELVKRLREQYAEQQKALNEQIRDQEREEALKQFDDIAESYDKEIEDLDDLAEELDKKLEEYLNPTNINKVLANAMSSGFVTIMGKTEEVGEIMSNFLKETTTGVYSTKDALKELADQLSNIGAIVDQLPGISDSLGLPDYTGSASLMRRNVELSSSQLVLNSPLVNIESLDSNSFSDFERIINEKINWLIGQLNDRFNY